MAVVAVLTLSVVRSSAAESSESSPGINNEPTSTDANASTETFHSDTTPKKIVLIPTQLDHPWATHMYPEVCQILAACLNKNTHVRAVVSPDLDWPKDQQLLYRS